MKNLDFLFPLSCEVAIFVPSTNNVNEAIDNVNEVNEVLAKLSGIFKPFFAYVVTHLQSMNDKISVFEPIFAIK